MSTATIDPTVLPSLPLDERRGLPDTAAIYFVLAGDTVLYVGQSTNLRQRWAAHHRLNQLNERGGCRIAWMQVDDSGLLGELERACIAHFNPALNDSSVMDRMLVEFGPGFPEEIRAMAVYKDQPPTVMVRGWIVERLRDEQRRMYRPGSEQRVRARAAWSATACRRNGGARPTAHR